MKNRITLILAVVLVAALACNFGAAPSTPASDIMPVIDSTATPVDEMEVEQETAAPTPEPTLEVTVTLPVPDITPSAPAAVLPPAVEGPQTLELSSPDLYLNPLTDYSEHFSAVISGLDQDSQPLDLTDRRTVRFQSQPSVAWYKSSQSLFDDAPLDSAAIDGQQYNVSYDMQCSQSTAGDPPVSIVSLLGSVFTGQAQRVEAGVMVNGLIADRYAIGEENLVADAQIELVETIKDGDSSSTTTRTIRVLGTGSLYLARQGSFVIKLEMSASKTATEEDFFFVPGSEMKNSLLFELMPAVAGEPPIAPPSACQDGAGSDTAEEDWPVMDDASMISQDGGEVIYQTYYALEDISQFYKTEMANRGWTLVDETNLAGSIVDLVFTKGAQEVTITLLQTGDTVTVTITQ